MFSTVGPDLTPAKAIVSIANRSPLPPFQSPRDLTISRVAKCHYTGSKGSRKRILNWKIQCKVIFLMRISSVLYIFIFSPGSIRNHDDTPVFIKAIFTSRAGLLKGCCTSLPFRCRAAGLISPPDLILRAPRPHVQRDAYPRAYGGWPR